MLNLSQILQPWNLAEWNTYPTPFQSSNGDASIGDGALTGIYKISGKSCSLQLALQWGSISNAGTGFIRVPLPSGVFPNSARMCTIAGIPITPVVAAGMLSMSPVAVNASFGIISGEFLCSSQLFGSLATGDFALMSAEFPIL